MLIPLLMQMLGPAVDAGGGGVANKNPLPKYFSRQIFDERVTLPQEPKSNEVAIEVLADLSDIEKRLAKQDKEFDEMLEIIAHLLKQIAVYVESQQIYLLVKKVEARVQQRRDNEIAELLADKSEEYEINELMLIL